MRRPQPTSAALNHGRLYSSIDYTDVHGLILISFLIRIIFYLLDADREKEFDRR